MNKGEREKKRGGGGGVVRGPNELELLHGWLERQRGDIGCLVVFIPLADFDFRW